MAPRRSLQPAILGWITGSRPSTPARFAVSTMLATFEVAVTLLIRAAVFCARSVTV